MNLKEFNKVTAPPNIRWGEPFVNVHSSGPFAINQEACELMKLKEGDHIVIAQSQDNPDDWYIIKSDKDIGFVTRRGSGKKLKLIANCARAAKELLNQAKIMRKSSTFRISREPMMLDKKLYWLIILSSGKK